MFKGSVLLFPARSDESSDFAGCKVTLAAGRKATEIGPGKDGHSLMVQPAELSATVDAQNCAVFAIPNNFAEPSEKINIRVHSPAGILISDTQSEARLLVTGVHITLQVPARPLIGSGYSTSSRAIRRLRGQVFEKSTQIALAGQPVILWVKKSASTGLEAIASTSTDQRGFFYIDCPTGQFQEARVTFAGGVSESITLTKEGSIPEKLIFVIQSATSTSRPDCQAPVPRHPNAQEIVSSSSTYSADLGGSGCNVMNKPNRSLEEFDYFSVVRTSSPVIRGLTLSASENLPGETIGKALVGESSEQRTSNNGSKIGDVDAIRIKNLLRQKPSLNHRDLVTASRQTRISALSNLAYAAKRSQPSRTEVGDRAQIDWDDEPTFYQSIDIAHGHILHFKQQWTADGYSLGDLLYSLPLAPGQKKRIAIVDWENKEVATSAEELKASDSISAVITRDRDISEVVNGMIAEQLSGASMATTSAVSIGVGLAGAGAVLGVAGSVSTASSLAFQDSARQAAANALQHLADRTNQAASSVRSQRSTVVRSVDKKESAKNEADIVANYNHCHALTMEYFEVLRHFKVSARLVDVRECLFVPLLLSPFDNLKALRWRTVLGPNLLDRSLLKAFDAIERIANDYLTEDFPVKRFADDPILQMKGTLSVSFKAVRPNDNPDGSFNKANWLAIEQLIGIDAREFFDNFLGDSSNRDDIFQARLTDDLAKAWFDSLQIIAVDEFDREHILAFDTTVLSNRRIRGNATIALKLSGPIRLNRASIRQVKVRSKLAGDPRFQRLMQQLQDDFRLILKSGNISYKTQHFDGKLFAEKSINDDIAAGDDATVSTPLTAEELRDPKEEDRCLSNRILSHLNEQLEYYHRAIWLQMDPQRRFMLLDGIFAPNSGGRSVASVVENRLIGIVGNCMIFPVTPGIHLDPTYSIDPIDPISLLGVYSSENEAILRVSLPSKGVFAEAVLGSCNSCEKKDESRFWRWEESPIPDSPTQINDISTQSRATAAPDLQGKELPATIINMQNAPAAPDPSGFSSLVQALSNANTFRDISGLTANQQSALAATQSTLQAAKAFGSGAVESAIQNNAVKNIDKVKNTLDDALKSGMITKEQASKALLNAVKSFSGSGDDSGQITGQNVVAAANQVMKDGGSLTFSSPEQEFELTTGLADSLGPPATAGSTAIFLKKPASDTAPERAFFPNDPINSKTGKVEFRAVASGVPKGGKIVWSIGTRKAGQTGNVDFGTKGTTSATGSKVTIRAVEPGLVDIDCKVVASGKTLASVKIPIAVPLFVQITEDKVKSKFEDFLAEYPTPDSNILALKDLFLENTKAVAEHIMRTANARLIWQVGPFNEKMPESVTSFSTISIKNRHEPITFGTETTTDGFVGLTPGGCTKADFTRAVEMYPGTLKHFEGGNTAEDRDILIFFRELMQEFENSNDNDPDKITNAATLTGRLLGAALAHEVGHVLSPECYDFIDAAGGRIQLSGHSRILTDIMYPGGSPDIELQTGWKLPQQSIVDFPATGTFEDNLLAPITTFYKSAAPEPVILESGGTAINCFQKEGSLNLIEKNFPIPPNLPPIIK